MKNFVVVSALALAAGLAATPAAANEKAGFCDLRRKDPSGTPQ
jgi:Skp family chaperone for outer membrane proteins